MSDMIILPVCEPGKDFFEYFVEELDVDRVGEADIFLKFFGVLIGDDGGRFLSNFGGGCRFKSAPGREKSFLAIQPISRRGWDRERWKTTFVCPWWVVLRPVVSADGGYVPNDKSRFRCLDGVCTNLECGE